MYGPLSQVSATILSIIAINSSLHSVGKSSEQGGVQDQGRHRDARKPLGLPNLPGTLRRARRHTGRSTQG